ncbi:hypothetical protein G6R29_04280 [Fructobacillus sp. M2-14]|uniref:Uncharacterized protein n=1 Tax=Fructobacillus broussonetiae TaxID=2713173 RepID=A0ABS5R082_9LACO|nr:hypothetical protein [Fructobacillus broussonetiae]MBS9338841.1 hypothetical protein [Fructobacillus broussonetiae]
MKTGTFVTFCFGYAFVVFYVYEEFFSRYINGFWINYLVQTAILVLGLIIIFIFKVVMDYKSGVLDESDKLDQLETIEKLED